jgi:hypothetical protein
MAITSRISRRLPPASWGSSWGVLVERVSREKGKVFVICGIRTSALSTRNLFTPTPAGHVPPDALLFLLAQKE